MPRRAVLGAGNLLCVMGALSRWQLRARTAIPRATAGALKTPLWTPSPTTTARGKI